MKHLVVYCHPNPASFSHAILTTLVATLEAQGHEVVVHDLYARGFDPVLSGADFAALQAGDLPADIRAEQAAVRDADVIDLVFPTWWAGLPARLKGWIDRVFLYGFAYAVTEQGIAGLLGGKQVRIFQTVGHPEAAYADTGNGMASAMRKTIDTGIFQFCGLTVVGHHYLWAVPYVDDAARKAYLAEIEAILAA